MTRPSFAAANTDDPADLITTAEDEALLDAKEDRPGYTQFLMRTNIGFAVLMVCTFIGAYGFASAFFSITGI